jgi:hypothetical protein
MPAGVSAYTALANGTISTTTTSITFSSISQSYRDLVIVMNVGGDNAGYTPGIRFNGDTAANYNMLTMAGDGSNASSALSSNNTFAMIGWTGSIGTTASGTTIVTAIMDYATTDKHKSFLTRSSNAGIIVDAFVNKWASTSAINTILIKANGIGSGNWAIGSTFALYGVSA